MADYSQPPFGVYFPVAPHPQHLAADAQANPQGGGSSDPYQTPAASNHQLNRLNLQSYAQNSRQPQYPYWPAPPAPQPNAYGSVPFPPPFLNQSGFPIPPPPPPGTSFFPTVPQMPLPNASAQSADAQPSSAFLAAPQPTTVTNDRLAGLDGDKEDGEVSEGSNSPAGHIKPIAKPPRSIPPLAKEPPPNDGQNESHSVGQGAPNHQSIVQTMYQPPSTAFQRSTGPTTLDDLKEKREEAKKFIKLLHANNIKYPVLAAEGLDEQLLRELYRDMNLPSQPEPIPAPTTGDTSNTSAKISQAASVKPDVPPPKTDTRNAQPKQAISLKTNVSATPAVKSATSPSDRQSYIARLQAAKMGKLPEAEKVVTLQHANPIVEQPAAKPVTSHSSPTNTVSDGSNSKPSLGEEERARQTELIKKRIEILKAAELARKNEKFSDSSPGTPQASADVGALPLPLPRKDDRAPQLSPTIAHTMENSDGAQSVRMASISKLPGLFMNSALDRPAATPHMATPNGTMISRKHPVSDFDEGTTPHSSHPAYTRPLGQSPHEHNTESMIIEVSDDDSAGSEMDLDDQVIPRSPSAFTPPSRGPVSSHPTHNLPGLIDFPSRSGSVKAIASTISTPPPVRTPASIQTQAEINRIEREALNLKLKIAEMSRNRKATAAKKDAIVSSPAPHKSGIVLKPKQESGPSKPSSNLLPSAPPDNASIQKSREWKKQRRAELESGLQSLDTETEHEKVRLAQLEKEIAEIAVKKQKRQHNREMLVQELESLGIDTEGMSDEELLAHKEEIGQLKEAQPHVRSSVPIPAAVEPSNDVVHPKDNPAGFGAPSNPFDVPRFEDKSIEPSAITSTATAQAYTSFGAPSNPFDVPRFEDKSMEPSPMTSTAQAYTGFGAPSNPFDVPRFEDKSIKPSTMTSTAQAYTRFGAPSNPFDVPRFEDKSMEPSAMISMAQVSSTQSPAPVEPVSQEGHMPKDVVRPSHTANSIAQEEILRQPATVHAPIVGPLEAIVESVNVQDYSTPVDDSEEDFYSPEPSIDQQPKPAAPSQNIMKSPSEQGEVDMSESPTSVHEEEEDEYEPGDHEAVANPSAEAPEAQQLDIANSPTSSMSSSSMSSSEDESESYEPPEPDQAMRDAEDIDAESNASTGVQADDGPREMDISMSSNERSSDQRSPSESTDMSISQDNAPNSLTNAADNLVSGLQSQEQTSVTGPPQEGPAIDPTHFVPYESPLRMFKSYRYHPQFSQEVAGGFSSQTYSHQIDPEKPLCRSEAAGGACDDPHCDGQHFRNMNITGEQLLVELGTANPGKTQEERNKWNDGLKLVLKKLRQHNIKDPTGIALEIAKYRRQFFNDDTRVVNL